MEGVEVECQRVFLALRSAWFLDIGLLISHSIGFGKAVLIFMICKMQGF